MLGKSRARRGSRGGGERHRDGEEATGADAGRGARRGSQGGGEVRGDGEEAKGTETGRRQAVKLRKRSESGAEQILET